LKLRKRGLTKPLPGARDEKALGRWRLRCPEKGCLLKVREKKSNALGVTTAKIFSIWGKLPPRIEAG